MNKKIIPIFTGIAIISVVTVAITLSAGSFSGRWGTFSGLDDARAALKALPMEIGDWQAEKEEELDKTSITMLRIQDSYVLRTYRNSATQAIVHLTFMVGPTGKITVHTPEVCFGGKDYEKDAARSSVQFDVQRETDEVVDSFWRISFTGRSLDTNNRISFYYAVSPGDTWTAVEAARATYQAYRYVYKLQAEAFSGAGEEGDNVRQFLEDCLPTIHKHMRPCK
jgi:hypothetical protein